MKPFIRISPHLQKDTATPVLLALMNEPGDKAHLHEAIADDIAKHTRKHIRDAALSRHKTALGFGMQPSGYLSKTAETVEATSDSYGVRMTVAGAIFARVNGPVTIRPREKKYLSIPIHRDAAGKSPREFTGLFIITSKKGNKLFVRRNADKTITPLFALKTMVVLPEDEGLLPTAKDYALVSEQTAGEYMELRLRQESAKAV